MRNFRLLFSQILIISVFLLSSCSKDSSPTIPVESELPVSFTMDKTTVRIGETITFTNTSQNAASYEWDFGDGNSSTEENPTHSYSNTGIFAITLTVNVEGRSGSKTKYIPIGDPVLEIYFDTDKSRFQGPTSFTAGPVKLHFYNESFVEATAILLKHDNGYSHQDMLDGFVNGYSEEGSPSWTTMIQGVWKQITPGDSHTWTGNLGQGLYTLASARITPHGVWYGAGLTVTDK
ncbi:MAG: PKD domain-containing protein [Bacteroidales bacterium]|nr:PKD domain-containing protein [Bacteroidales bacterium]